MAYDLSGHCANGAYAASATGLPGDGPPADTGGAVNLGGVVTQTGQNLPTGNSPRTYEVWFNGGMTGNGSNAVPLLRHGDVELDYLTWNGDRFGPLGFGVCGTCPGVPTAPYSVHDGTWHMLAAAWDGTNFTFYIDGLNIGSVSRPPAFNTSPNAGLVLAPGYSAKYAELAVFNTALNPGIIADQSSGGLGQGPIGGAITGGELYGNKNVCFACLAKHIRSIAGDPVDTATGNFSETFHDLSVPGRGVPLDFSRSYNSGAATTNGPLGYGWTSSYNVSLAIAAGAVTVNQENGAQVNFTLSNGVYTAPPRVIATLVKNGDGTYTFTRQHTQILGFSSTGQLQSETDLNGQSASPTYATTLAYTGGQLTTVTDPAGRSLSIAYQGTLITGVTDVATGRVVHFGYNDGAGNLTDVTDANTGASHFGYGAAPASHLLTTIQDPRLNTTTNHYDAQSRVDIQTDRMNRQTTFAYAGSPLTAAGGSTTITDPRTYKTVDQYQYGLRISETKAFGTPSAATWTYTYDPATVAVSTMTDPNGHVWSYTYDMSGNLLTSTDPLSRQTVNTWDAIGDMTSTTDPLQVMTTNTFDSRGDLLSTARPLIPSSPPVTSTATYAYADTAHPGDVTRMTDPDQNLKPSAQQLPWQYGYDQYGNKNLVIDPGLNKTTSTFNADGWLLTKVSPNGYAIGPVAAYTTSYDYTDQRLGAPHINGFGDVGITTDPLGRKTTLAYDANRNLTDSTDANVHKTHNVYDADNELTEVDRADNGKLLSGYDANGNVASQTDGLNQPTAYLYDPLNHQSSVKDPLLRTTGYVFRCRRQPQDRHRSPEPGHDQLLRRRRRADRCHIQRRQDAKCRSHPLRSRRAASGRHGRHRDDDLCLRLPAPPDAADQRRAKGGQLRV